MLTTLATAIFASDEPLAPLIAPAPVIAVVVGLIFLMMGLVTFAYRDVANRQSPKKSGTPNGPDAGH
jgi:hypothetical protein